MDFGDIIYIVLAIVFSAAGAYSKRKKKQQPVTQKKKSSPARDIFEELFDMKEKVDDPVQQFDSQQVYEEDIVPDFFVSEDLERPVERTFAEEVAFHQKPEPQAVVVPEVIAVKEKAHKPHFILDELKKRKEVQKAVIYSEILKPKF